MKIPERYRQALSKWYNIDQRHSNIQAEVKAWVESTPRGCLIFYGPPGTGKTTMALWAMQRFIDLYDAEARYITALEIYQKLKTDYSKEDALRLELAKIPLLIIDEIDLFGTSESAWLFINQVISKHYDELLPMILITNLDLPELEDKLGERIYDRLMEWGKGILFSNKSYRERGKAND